MNVYLKDYLQHAAGRDMTPALNEALRACKSGDTLCLGGGELHFYGQYAHQRAYYVSNNDYSNKKIIFYLKDRQGLTIDGEGAELIFHGQVTPFVVDGCCDILIRNLHVDYQYPFYAQARITAATEEYTELTFDNQTFFCKIKDNQFCFYSEEDGWEVKQDSVLVTEFEDGIMRPSPYLGAYFDVLSGPKDDFLASMYRYMKAEQKSENTIRLTGHLGYTHTVGNWWVCTFGGRHNPGFFITESAGVALEDLHLYHTASMGVIAQLSRDISLERVCCAVRPDSGRALSVSADATHFVNCEGTVSLTDCRFTSMLDDAGNFHGIYMPVEKKIDDHTLLAKFGHFQQEGICVFRPGDRIRFVDNRNMTPYGELTVQAAEMISGQYFRLTTQEMLPEELRENHVVENITRMPDIFICGCVAGNNRPRGFLVNTNRKAVIENCTFFNMNSAIECCGDANSWYESGPVSDILIRNNRFENAAYAGGVAVNICPVVPDKGAETYHKNIVIRNNHFVQHEKRFLSARFVRGLVFADNTFALDETLPSHKQVGEEGIRMENCEDCVIETAKERNRL